MAPARHETGPPQENGNGTDDKTPYGTRASKRKASELSSAPPPPVTAPSTSGSKASSRLSKAKAAPKKAISSNEPRQPPAKKRRSSSTLAPDGPSSSSSGAQLSDSNFNDQNSVNSNDRISSPVAEAADQVPGSSATPGPDADSVTQQIPNVLVDGPTESSGDVPNSPVLDDDALEPRNGTGVSGAGRGRGRGRGSFRGRGGFRGRGSRGGRVSKAVANGRGGKPAPPSRGRGTGRGRGGRRKKPEDPVIDAIYKRKTELKAQYKAIAIIQRDALVALSEKSLEMVKNDPKYHETLPEFQKVSDDLKAEFEKRQRQLDAVHEHEVALAKRTFDYKAYTIEEQYRVRIEEIQEEYSGRIKEQTNYIYYAKTKNLRDIDEIPFSRGEDGRVVKQSVPPPKRVHATGHPFMDPGKAVFNAKTMGDNDFEQHPANWWHAKSKREKAAILKKQAENVAEKERLHRAEMGGGRGKRGGRQALFQPNAQQESAEGGEPVAEAGEEGEEQPEEEVTVPDSPPATGEGSPEEEAETNVSDDVEDSDAQPQEVDEFGVSIPRRKVRRDQPAPYNRIQADAPVHFEPHEIGLRRTHFQKQPDGSSKKLGRDIDPNPKDGKFFYEQRQGRYNAGKNQLEDLDQEIVATHKLHPRLGLPIAGSINPDFGACKKPYFKEPTDWNKPWKNSNPIMFIHTSLDGKRTISRTSRSEWQYRAERAFDQIPAAEKMGELLEETGDRESREPTPVIPESPQIIAKDLVEAVNDAVNDDAAQRAKDEARWAEEERISMAARSAQFSPHAKSMFSPAPQTPVYQSSGASMYSPPSAFKPQNVGFSSPAPMAPPPPPPPPPQRSHGYDPVRDRTYVTPYSQPVRQAPPPPPPPPPAPHANYTNGGNLSELANIMEYYPSKPLPSAYGAPINPYGAPPMMPQQQQRLTGMTGMHPGMGVFGHHHQQVSPYGPPPPPSSRGGPSGGNRRAARELRPAPPSANSRPPPPPPQHQWRGYGGSGYSQ